MEFFIIAFSWTVLILLGIMIGFIIGYERAKKKFLPNVDTLSVSTNEKQVNICLAKTDLDEIHCSCRENCHGCKFLTKI